MALADFILEVHGLSMETHEASDRSLYPKYLTNAGIILAKVIRDREVVDEIETMERLFGQTWLNDSSAYEKIYSVWNRLKELLNQSSIHGMSVNERLSLFDLLDEFDSAVKKHDATSLKRILTKCLLDEKSIEAIIKSAMSKK